MRSEKTRRIPLTPWGERLDRRCPLSEYPRPQLRRERWLNLNGPWQYAIRSGGGEPSQYDGEILVPFSPESALSGVNRPVLPGDTLWYRRNFLLPEGFQREGEVQQSGKWIYLSDSANRVLLHFGAVDQSCWVYLNGQLVGRHEGGYLPFTFDVTAALTEGVNTLVLSVVDATSRSRHACGKQSLTPGGIWYTPQSGIWQTVWMESVPENYVEKLLITPLCDEKRVRFVIQAKDPETANVVVRKDGVCIAEDWYDADKGQLELCIMDEHFCPWTPENPFLYDVTVTLGSGDVVESYFAMRQFGTALVEGRKVLALNGRPLFMSGVLDQGYWSDGLYTAPSDEAMVFDIQTMKDCGFNMLRKHGKIEPLRWYYHCDRLGMIVWQDLPSGGRMYPLVTQVLPFLGVHLRDGRHRIFGREDGAGRKQFLADLRETVELLYSTPSVAVWVPFNEGWGQFDSLQATQLLWELDPTRLVDHASGWHDQGGGDFKSRHVYFRPVRLRHDGSRVLALTEFGGYSLPVPGHMTGKRPFGYRRYAAEADFRAAWEKLYQEEVLPHVRSQGLSASVYTQLSDVEDEVNGLLTFDRRVCKVDPARLREINEGLKFS
ncbi:MAG: glycoside hydrolase family 2 [Oscillospiraceae bacterium]|nr:glycoside hydrolase family 2 [Oscillospiraceae bacterium]